MELERINTFIDSSPAVRLLRADSAPFVLDFLYQTFKSKPAETAIDLSQDDLRSRLVIYQERLHETNAQALTSTAERYLLDWSDAGWLRRFLPASATQPHYQLTRFAEDALRFVETSIMRRSQLVGTESRLRLVIETLGDLVRGASPDRDARLRHLHAQRQAIDDQILALEAGGAVETYRPAQIRERFQTAVNLLRDLQSDFRAVEDRFAEIAAEVQRTSQADSRSRGEILAGALDAEELLKEQDEGISFYAFVSFLFSPHEQAELRQTIRDVTGLAAITDERESIGHVRQMVPSLLVEADKVLRTTGRLSQTLRRLLDGDSAEHRRRTAEVLRDIRQLAAQLRGNVLSTEQPVPEDIGLVVETSAGIGSPMSRLPWSPPQVFEQSDIEAHTVDLRAGHEAARKLHRMQRIELDRMRSVLLKTLSEYQTLTIAKLIEHRPPRAGVIELVGWLQIAHEDGYSIDTDANETVWVDGEDQRRIKVRLPLVTFVGRKETPR